jgi:hypothetical protein
VLVYGDARRREDPREKAAAIRRGLERWRTAPLLPIERHALLAELLIEAGELEQGLLDTRAAALGEEVPGPLEAAASRLTRAAAVLLLASFRALGDLGNLGENDEAAAIRALGDLLARELPAAIEVSTPEGFAFYGLYPESYLAAAEQALRPDVRVIGIRSIGTGLAALVAAVSDERAQAFSVRPQGHPFDRRLVLGAPLETALLGGKTEFAIVDEGPGLSGSSFGCVADWLEDHGVAPAAITFFPSHRGHPGPYANPRHRARWRRARRRVVEFEDLFLSPAARWPPADWVRDLTGEATEPLADLSAGRWREQLVPDRSRWPAADVQGERRKILLTAASGPWLLKFAGLGRYGRETLALARELEGLIPPVAGLRHGFLVGPWLADARPLPLTDVDPRALLDTVASYLAVRAARLPAPPESRGATPMRLFEMAVHNTQRALGPAFAAAVKTWRGRLPEIARLARPVLTDNRMHAWEWLVTPEGRILKADALDHHRGNDLVGPQDVAWDLAGAAVELDLDDDALERLAAAVARRSGRPRAQRIQLDFYTLAYLAFQTGRHTLAAEALESGAPAESARMRAAVERYVGRLQGLIAGRRGSGIE